MTSVFVKIFLDYLSSLTMRKVKKIVLCVIGILFVYWLFSSKFANTIRLTTAITCKNKITKIVFPNPIDEKKYLSDMHTDPHILEKDYFQMVAQFQRQCYDQERLGPEGDGGWRVCMDPQFIIAAPCLVYSFGVGDDGFDFEEDVVRKLGCEVHAFDPSIGLESHQRSEKIMFHNHGIDSEDSMVHGLNWKMKKLSTIIKTLKHQDKSIDLLKLDVEFSEWPALYDMIQSGTINKVRQLVLETHTPEMEIHRSPKSSCTYSSLQSMQFMLKVIMLLQQSGFRTYFSTTNYRTEYISVLTGQQRYCCHNVFMVNMNHPRNAWVHR